MPTFSYSNAPLPTPITNGTTPDADQVMQHLDDLKTFLNSTKLDATNLQDGAITTVKIADDAVTGAKLGVVTTEARASGNLTLSNILQDVPGCTYTATVAGDYLIRGYFYFGLNLVGVSSGSCQGVCLVNGVQQTGIAHYGAVLGGGGATFTAVVCQEWRVTGVAATQVIKLQANYDSASSATLSLGQTHSKLLVQQVG